MKAIIVEDEQVIIELLTFILEKEGFDITVSSNGFDFIKKISLSHYDLAILDINLPDFSGIELCEIIKKNPQKFGEPLVFMLTGETSQDKINLSLKCGADDYIIKPFNKDEFILRIKNNLKKVKKYFENIKIKDVKIDLHSEKVSRKEDEIQLTNSEFNLLNYLVRNKNQKLSREKIINDLKGENYVAGTDRTIDLTISRIRKKVPEIKDYIRTIRGYGYEFRY